MAIRIPSKKSKSLRRWLAASVLILGAPSALAGTTGDLPVIKTIGIIPTQLEEIGSDHISTKLLDEIRMAFSLAVRDAHRFNTLDDNLTKVLWNSVTSRKELLKEYELSAFAHLTVVTKEDAIVLIGRILSPDLEPYLQEIATINRFDMEHADYAAVDSAVHDLVYRLLNRLPIDVSVSSIQGAYITLTGGINQGIHPGQSIDLIHAKVAALHPATKAWQNFEGLKVGTAKIISAEEHTSVARITQLLTATSLNIGDGARIQDIAGRLKYRQVASAKDHDAFDTILVQPMYDDKNSVAIPEPLVAAAAAAPVPIPPPPAQEAPKNVEPEPAPTVKAEEPPPVETKSEPQASTQNGQSPVSELTIFGGPIGWHFKGLGRTTSSRFSFYPVNVVGAAYTGTLAPNVKYTNQLSGNFGQVGPGGGSYLGFDLSTRMFWDIPLDNNPIYDRLLGGGQGAFKALRISAADFGGANLLSGAGFVEGWGHARMFQQNYDWFTTFVLSPLGVGFLGHGGRNNTVASYFAWNLEVGALQQYITKTRWGVSVSYGSEQIGDKTGKSELKTWILKVMRTSL